MLDQVLAERKDDFYVVALSVDENDAAAIVRDRAADHDSDTLRWAVSPKTFTDALVEEFGPSVIVPPTAPVIVIDAEQKNASLMRKGPKNAVAIDKAVDGAY